MITEKSKIKYREKGERRRNMNLKISLKLFMDVSYRKKCRVPALGNFQIYKFKTNVIVLSIVSPIFLH